MAWVNSQLKKKTGVRQIEDLRNDMKDGVAIIDLIEIVCKLLCLRFSDDLFVPPYDSFPMNPEKKTLIPYIYNASNKDPS